MILSNYQAHYKATLKLGLPIIIGQIGNVVLGVADTLMIGQHSTAELAAASFVNNILTLMILLGTGFSYGLTPIVGQLFGQGNNQAVGRALKSSVIANSFVGLAITIVMIILYFNVDKLHQPIELIIPIQRYMLLLLSTLPLIMIFNAFKNTTDTIGYTAAAMWIMIGGNALNIGLNYLLINGIGIFPELGLMGAGWATTISRIVMAIAMVCTFFFSSKLAHFKEGYRSAIDWSIVKQLNIIGWPIALQLGMETASFSLSAVMMGWLGVLALAAHQIMITISTFTFMIFYGIGAAVSIRVSYFNGQHDSTNVRYAANAGYHIIVFIGVVLCLGLTMLRTNIGWWFTSDNNVVELTALLMIPMLAYQVGDGLQVNYANALRGLADVKAMALIAFVAYFVVSLPMGYILAFIVDMGALGVWLAFPFGLTTAGVLFLLRFRHVTKQ